MSGWCVCNAIASQCWRTCCLTTSPSLVEACPWSSSLTWRGRATAAICGRNARPFQETENMTYNAHLRLHLTRSVRNWAPLWAHSAFVFEAYKHSKGSWAMPLLNAKCIECWMHLHCQGGCKSIDHEDLLKMQGVFVKKCLYVISLRRYYRRIVVNVEVINSETCTRKFRRNSSTVVLNDDKFVFCENSPCFPYWDWRDLLSTRMVHQQKKSQFLQPP